MIPDIDLASLFLDLETKFSKDEFRMVAFSMAIAKKTSDISHASSPYIEQLPEFLKEAGTLVGAWVHKTTHLQFPKDFEGDPYADLRDQTRMFAHKWSLDPAFIAIIG